MASSSSATQSILAFGLEMEFLIRPNARMTSTLIKQGWDAGVKPNNKDEQRKTTNRAIMHRAIAGSLRAAGVPAGLNTQNFKEWTVVDERSLDEVGDYWRVELVSRTMFTVEIWQYEVDQVFRGLLADWDIRLTTGCSMHVHVSTGITQETRYTMDQIRRIMKGIALFDDAITKIMPAYRKNNEWAMSNFQGREAPARLKQLYAAVPTHTWAPLFERFDKVKMKQMVFLELGQSRYMSWNFSNLNAQCGTVEFRRPPAVGSAPEAKHWAGVTLGFVSQALITDYTPYKSSKQYPPVISLSRFVNDGINRLGRTCQGAVNNAALVENRSAAAPHTAAELQAIARKKAEKNSRGSPFVEKANSRPNTPVSRDSSPEAMSNASNGSGKSRKKHRWF
ncbi:hypothetical protein DL766_007197 [Monosporascus sp. MC13-8B]|nr:hypothetical protein DL766_007197 [Monosporascus sp. MC13-8B]